jgi:hypothetical protein
MRPSKARSSSRALVLNAVAVLALETATGAAAVETPDLWARAVATMNAGPKLTPEKLYQKFELLDGKGAPTLVNETWMELTRNDRKKLEMRRVKVLKDGKDVTREELERERKERASHPNQGKASAEDDPFLLRMQPGVTATRRGAEDVGGRACVAYDYVLRGSVTYDDKKQPTTFRGRAWLDASTGAPVKTEYTQDPLPKMTKEMKTTVDYAAHASGRPVVSHVTVEGAGGFLFIKKRFRMTLLFAGFAELDIETGE